MQLRTVLKKLIKSHGLTIRELSSFTGVSQSTLKTWLGGATPRSMNDVRKVAQHFDVSLDFLFFGEGNEQNNNFDEMPVEDVFDGWVRINIQRLIRVNTRQKK